MAYTKQAWVDGVTPLDATHMNYMETGLESMVDTDNVVAAASQLVANKLAAGDAQPAFRILGDGQHAWGPGGATAPDTFLSRPSAAQLTLIGGLRSTVNLVADGSVYTDFVNAGGRLYFGSAADTNLYRAVANTLKTDGNFLNNGDFSTLSGDVIVRSGNAAGQIQLGLAGIYFGTAFDTRLYRSAAGTLSTNSEIRAVGRLVAGQGTAGHTDISADAKSTIWLGNAYDTNLYRSGANQLKTDDLLIAAGQVVGSHAALGEVAIGDIGPSAQPGIQFSNLYDTKLYRSSANVLRTDGFLSLGNHLYCTSGYIYLAANGDTAIYRQSSGQLRVSGPTHTLGLGDVGNTPGIAFSAADDCKIYRYSAKRLESDSLWGCLFSAANAGAGGLRVLEAGAADSGGAGYRMVRVVN